MGEGTDAGVRPYGILSEVRFSSCAQENQVWKRSRLGDDLP